MTVKLPTTEQARRTLRTALAVLVATASLIPVIVAVTGLTVEQSPVLASIVAAAAVVTRVMADPRVNELLRRVLGEPFAVDAGVLEAPAREDRVE